MLQSIEAERLYRNIKTQQVYRVVAIARHSETEEELVVYQKPSGSGSDFDTWARPLDLFKEKFELP